MPAVHRRRLSQEDYLPHLGRISPSPNVSSPAAPIPDSKTWTFIHIPKTAGDSFMREAENHMLTGTNVVGNREKSFLTSDTSLPMVVFLRHPTAHVLSQFLECKYHPWGKHVTNNTGFPGYYQMNHTLEGFDEWVLHFDQLKTNRTWFGIQSAYNCYDPYNMQARYFTTEIPDGEAHSANSTADQWPNIESARERLNSVHVVGIMEHFPASLCLFEYEAGGHQFLTEGCQVCEGGELKVAKTLIHEVHNVPPHSIDSISTQTRFMIQNMTTIDQQLYESGLDIFQHHVDQIRDRTGMDLLCRGQQESSSSPTAGLSFPPSFGSKEVANISSSLFNTTTSQIFMLVSLMGSILLVVRVVVAKVRCHWWLGGFRGGGPGSSANHAQPTEEEQTPLVIA
jgi:hypothetical protein